MAYEQPISIQTSIPVDEALPVIKARVSAILRGEVIAKPPYNPYDKSNILIQPLEAHNGSYRADVIIRDYRPEKELMHKGMEVFLKHSRETEPNPSIDKRIEDEVKEAFGIRRKVKELLHMDVRDAYSYLLRMVKNSYRRTTPTSLEPFPP